MVLVHLLLETRSSMQTRKRCSKWNWNFFFFSIEIKNRGWWFVSFFHSKVSNKLAWPYSMLLTWGFYLCLTAVRNGQCGHQLVTFWLLPCWSHTEEVVWDQGRPPVQLLHYQGTEPMIVVNWKDIEPEQTHACSDWKKICHDSIFAYCLIFICMYNRR